MTKTQNPKNKPPTKIAVKKLQITDDKYIVTQKDDTVLKCVRTGVFFSLTTKDQNAIRNLKPLQIFLFGLELDPTTLTFINV